MAIQNSNGREQGTFDDEITKDIQRKLSPRLEDLILNIGCGTGILESAHPTFEIISVDFSMNMLRRSGVKNGIMADASHLPFKGGIFDKICAYSVIQYLDNAKISNMIAGISFSQKSKGVCLLGDVELRSRKPIKLLRYLFAFLLVKNRFHYHSIARIKRVCNSEGLMVKVLKQSAVLPFSERRIDLLLMKL
jgi:SAM-dependent methyltransferase